MCRIQVSLAAVGLLLSRPFGCASPAGTPPDGEPAPLAPILSPPADPVGTSVPVESLLRTEFNDDGRVGLLIAPSGKFVATLDELRQALPDLPARARRDPRYLHQLVHGLMTVTRWTSACITRAEDIEDKLRRHLDPDDVLERPSWNTQYVVSAPSPEQVKPPRWEGDALVVDCIDPIVGIQDTFSGTRHRFTLTEAAWSHAAEDLAGAHHVPERARARVAELFGGEVRGFIRFPAGTRGALHVALSPAASASRYVWRPASGDPQRFATWAEFSRTIDAFAAPAAFAEFVGTLVETIARQGIRHDDYRIIADPAAYREDYKQNRRDTEKLRYHVDEVKTTRFTVHDFDAIRPPTIERERLVAFFSDGRGQPVRIELDLSTLDWDTPLQMVKLFDERVIGDTGTLFGGPSPLNSEFEPTPEPRPHRRAPSHANR